MKKILVIFFLALIPLIFIYNHTKEKENLYLAIGDALALGHTPFDTYNKSYVDYLYDYLENKNFNLNKEYTKEDIRIKDIINELKSEDAKTLSQLIKDAKIITISIGSEEVFSKIRSTYNLEKVNISNMREYIDNIFNDYSTLLKEIKKINKNDIYIIGYYNPIKITEKNKTSIEELFSYIDTKFKKLEKENDVIYIEIYKSYMDNSMYLPNKQNAFPSLEGYSYIAEEIKKKVSF